MEACLSLFLRLAPGLSSSIGRCVIPNTGSDPIIEISAIGLVWKHVHLHVQDLLQDGHPELGDVIPNAGSDPRIEISAIGLVCVLIPSSNAHE